MSGYKEVSPKDFPITSDTKKTVRALQALGTILGGIDVLENLSTHPSIPDLRDLVKCIADDLFGEMDSTDMIRKRDLSDG